MPRTKQEGSSVTVTGRDASVNCFVTRCRDAACLHARSRERIPGAFHPRFPAKEARVLYPALRKDSVWSWHENLIWSVLSEQEAQAIRKWLRACSCICRELCCVEECSRWCVWVSKYLLQLLKKLLHFFQLWQFSSQAHLRLILLEETKGKEGDDDFKFYD